MNRRETVLAIAAASVLPDVLLAQQVSPMPVIGFLHPGFAGAISGSDSALEAMLAGLGSLGYVVGKTIKIEYRWAQGKVELLPSLARELIKLKVDLIVAVAPPAVKAAMAATQDLAIVAHDLETDPVAGGLVSSLARPRREPDRSVPQSCRPGRQVAAADHGDQARRTATGGSVGCQHGALPTRCDQCSGLRRGGPALSV